MIRLNKNIRTAKVMALAWDALSIVAILTGSNHAIVMGALVCGTVCACAALILEAMQ